MHKRIILVAKGAGGKDHLRKRFEKQGFTYAVSYTTRPPREGEVDGKDYIFISEDEFLNMIANNEWQVSPDGTKIVMLAANDSALDGLWLLDVGAEQLP